MAALNSCDGSLHPMFYHSFKLFSLNGAENIKVIMEIVFPQLRKGKGAPVRDSERQIMHDTTLRLQEPGGVAPTSTPDCIICVQICKLSYS